MSATPTYLTAPDIAKSARVSTTLVRRWITTGLLRPASRTARGVWLFDPAEVERWLATWSGVRRRPYTRAAARLPVEGLDRPAPVVECGIPPPIPRTAHRRGLPVASSVPQRHRA